MLLATNGNSCETARVFHVNPLNHRATGILGTIKQCIVLRYIVAHDYCIVDLSDGNQLTDVTFRNAGTMTMDF